MGLVNGAGGNVSSYYRGASYIGSHTTYALLDRGERMVVLDNLCTGILGLVSKRAKLFGTHRTRKTLLGFLHVFVPISPQAYTIYHSKLV